MGTRAKNFEGVLYCIVLLPAWVKEEKFSANEVLEPNNAPMAGPELGIFAST